MSEERICSKCGNKLNNDELFCGECGCKYEEKASNNAEKNITVDENTTNDEIMRFGSITLTKDYIYQRRSKIGAKYAVYIFLKDTSSIELGYKSHPIFIILAVIFLGIGGYFAIESAGDDIGVYMLMPYLFWAIVFVVLFFITRARFLLIRAHNRVEIAEKYTGGSKVEKFINIFIDAKRKLI